MPPPGAPPPAAPPPAIAACCCCIASICCCIASIWRCCATAPPARPPPPRRPPMPDTSTPSGTVPGALKRARNLLHLAMACLRVPTATLDAPISRDSSPPPVRFSFIWYSTLPLLPSWLDMAKEAISSKVLVVLLGMTTKRRLYMVNVLVLASIMRVRWPTPKPKRNMRPPPTPAKMGPMPTGPPSCARPTMRKMSGVRHSVKVMKTHDANMLMTSFCSLSCEEGQAPFLTVYRPMPPQQKRSGRMMMAASVPGVKAASEASTVTFLPKEEVVHTNT
mmetsp:Transcript_8550/g.23512  ORF Transcript_8550/g.23512 Transcript_8550/m.23512 type:complete len:277 (-) Transcript_8550:124-954(-)